MPCDTVVPQKDFLDVMRELEDLLLGNAVEVVVDQATGAVALVGWQDSSRRGVSDVCAIQKLMAENSFAWQRALATAESIAGRQMDINMLSSGVHSHDGGSTWHPGH